MAKTLFEIRNLKKIFKTKNGDVEALKDINLDICSGDIYGIIGLSGAGKSTLVRCMNLLEKPTGGEVIFDGENLAKLKDKDLNRARKNISMIFQQFNLLMQRNALQNVCFPMEIAKIPRAEAVKKAKELLAVVDLEGREKAYPSQLSGGQKQRVAIARALATNPKVLLCDEATSALDPKTTRSILDLLKEINEKYGITIVIITHEMGIIQQICHKVAIIDAGRIAEKGLVGEIFSSPKTEVARKLIMPDGQQTAGSSNGRLIRIVFDGRSSYEPVIANMVLECRSPVNIMYANTHDIEGEAVGQMVLSLSEDDRLEQKQINFLKSNNIRFEEIEEVEKDV